jgi:ActR/RegA family two-component response regulator
MAVSTAPLDVAARAVVSAACGYVDSDDPAETEDLLFSLESAVMAYRTIEQAEAASADRMVCEQP